MKALGIITIAALLALTTACRSSHDYVTEADRLFSAKKYAEAALIYRKAIQKDPQSAEAYYRLGLAQHANGNYPAAYESFIHAVSLNPQLEKAQVELGNLYLGDYLIETTKSPQVHEKIAAIAQQLLAKDPQSFAGLRFRGYLALSDHQTEDAIAFFHKAHSADPSQPDVVLGLTQALLMAGRYSEARQTAAGLIEAHRTFASIYDVLYAYEMSTGHAADAEALLKLKISNNPQDPESVLQLAEHYWRTGRKAQSFQVLDGILGEANIPWRTYSGGADFYERNQQWERASEALTAGLKAHPEEQLSFVGAKVRLLQAQGQTKQAIALLSDTLQQHPNATELKQIRAVLLLDSSDAAGKTLALRDLQTLAQSSPADMAIAFQLGRAFSQNGMPLPATRQFEQVIRSQPGNVAALLALAELSSTAQRFQQSLLYSERILELQPGLRNASLLHATALVGLGRLDEAHVEYNRLIHDQPGYAEAKLQLAMLDVLLKRYSESERLFRDLYRPKAGDFRALKGLVEVYLAQGQEEKALALLNGELTRFPDSIAVHSILATTAARSGKVDLAIQQYERLLAKRAGDQDTCTQLGQLYQRKGDLPRALSLFQTAADLAPSDWRALGRLGAAQQASGLAANAAGTYRHAIELGADNPDLFNNLAYLEADSGTNLEDALALSQKALSRSPGNAQYADTVGYIYLKKHDNAAALQIFQAILKRFPNDAGFRYHLALALLQSGKREQGQQELRAAVAANPSLADQARVQHLLGQN